MLSVDSTEQTKKLMAEVWPVDRVWESVEEARADVEIFANVGDPIDGVSIRDVTIPGPHGALRLRVYRPDDAVGALPGLLYFHGGGFVVGAPEGFDWLCGTLAQRARHVVVNVDYHLAPEHPFPEPVEEALSVAKHVSTHGDEFGIDPTRLSVAGDSAGANLATVVCLLAREDGPKILHQVLYVPFTQPYADTPSMRDLGTGYFPTREIMDWHMARYLPGGRAQANDPLCAPLLRDDLAGLPPATVITAEFDSLRDEGELYAQKLAAAGVRVDAHRMIGAFHLTANLPKAFPEAAEEVAELVSAQLREAAGIA